MLQILWGAKKKRMLAKFFRQLIALKSTFSHQYDTFRPNVTVAGKTVTSFIQDHSRHFTESWEMEG